MALAYREPYLYCLLDELVVRGLMWEIIRVSLHEHVFLKLCLLLALEGWYTVVLLWHRPFRNWAELLANIFGEIGSMLMLTAFIFEIQKPGYEMQIVLSIACLHLAVLVGITIVTPLFHILKRMQVKDRTEDPETAALLASTPAGGHTEFTFEQEQQTTPKKKRNTED